MVIKENAIKVIKSIRKISPKLIIKNIYIFASFFVLLQYFMLQKFFEFLQKTPILRLLAKPIIALSKRVPGQKLILLINKVSGYKNSKTERLYLINLAYD